MTKIKHYWKLEGQYIALRKEGASGWEIRGDKTFTKDSKFGWIKNEIVLKHLGFTKHKLNPVVSITIDIPTDDPEVVEKIKKFTDGLQEDFRCQSKLICQ